MKKYIYRCVGYSPIKADLLVKSGEDPNTVRYGGHQRYCIINNKEVRVPLPERVDSYVSDMESYRHGATNGQSMELSRVQDFQGGIQKRDRKPPNGPPILGASNWILMVGSTGLRSHSQRSIMWKKKMLPHGVDQKRWYFISKNQHTSIKVITKIKTGQCGER